jgi:uncharacterized cupredoxin-like copper-binding protein
MNHARSLLHATAVAGLFAAVVGAAHAKAPAQSLAVELQDSTTDPKIAQMRMVLDHSTLHAGRVTLHAVNQSKSLVHEVVIARDDGGKALPFDSKLDRVVERRVHRLGEIADLKPGHSGTLTVDLQPGTYMLFCNQPGHYKDGMYAKLVVER